MPTGTDATFPSGQTIVWTGKRAERCYEVASGVVRLTRHLQNGARQILDFRFPGEVFGLVTGYTHQTSAECIGTVEVRSFPKATLEQLARDNHDMCRYLYRLTRAEVQRRNEHISLLRRPSAMGRVAGFLLNLSMRLHGAGSLTEGFQRPMCQMDIADYLGLTNATVSRNMGALRKDGIIRAEGHYVQILDVPGLRQLADDTP